MKHTGSRTIIVDDFETIFCNFVKIKDNVFECSKCGNIVTAKTESDLSPVLPCKSPLLSDNIASSVIKFGSEIDHMKNDLCSEERIQIRYNTCQQCEFFKDNSCEKCGCTVIRDRNYLNKLAVKSEHCPIDKW